MISRGAKSAGSQVVDGGSHLHVPGLKSEVPGLRPGKTRLKRTPDRAYKLFLQYS